MVASVFVLALFVGIFYRQDLETAAAQTRGALTVAAASISPHRLRAKPSWSRLCNHGTKAEGDRFRTERPLARVARRWCTGHSELSRRDPSGRALELQHGPVGRTDAHAERHVKLWRNSPNGTTAVIVQPNDDLRQICLRHLGRYNAEVLHEIRNSILSSLIRIASLSVSASFCPHLSCSEPTLDFLRCPNNEQEF